MLTHFSVTQQGQRHIEKQTPCQDYSESCRIHMDQIDCDLVLAAVSDGVGSCEFSQYGSETAVTSLINYLKNNLGKLSVLTDNDIIKVLKAAFEHALANVEAAADEKKLPFLEFDSTLTGAVYDGHNLWFGHIGDDGVVALYTDGTYEMISTRHKGEEAHSVFPLRNTELWQFGKASKEVASFALMTDGVLDYCVDSAIMNNRVYFPFLEPALTEIMDSDTKAEHQRNEWNEFFMGSPSYSDNFRTKVTDDISFVIVQNSDAVGMLPEIEFDFIQWEADSAQRRRELNDALYGDYRAYKTGLAKKNADEKAEQKLVTEVSSSIPRTGVNYNNTVGNITNNRGYTPTNTEPPHFQTIKSDTISPNQHKAADTNSANIVYDMLKFGYSAGQLVRESLFQSKQSNVSASEKKSTLAHNVTGNTLHRMSSDNEEIKSSE